MPLALLDKKLLTQMRFI